MPKNCTLDPSQLAVTLQIAGSVYFFAESLSGTHRLRIHLSEIASSVATIMLLIAKSALTRKPRVSITSEQKTGILSWPANVPPDVRAIAMASLGQILIANEAVAKKLINQFVQIAVSAYCSSTDLGAVVMNCTIVSKGSECMYSG